MNALRAGFQQTVSLRHRLVVRAGQAINLLQMSRLELSDAISQELEENPLLEVDEIESDEELMANSELADESSELDWSQDELEIELKETLQAHTPDDARHDVGDLDQLNPNESIENEIEWDDQTVHVEPKLSTEESDSSQFLENQSLDQDLKSHLTEQLLLSKCNEQEVRIASIVFEFLNDDGMISISIDELLAEVNLIESCSLEMLEDVLTLVQQFSPLGVCARNLRECLIIQTRAHFDTEPIVPTVLGILKNHFNELANQQFDKLATEYGAECWQKALEFIGHLKPRPAAAFSSVRTTYIEPDARIRKVSGEWRVELLDGDIPQLKLSDWYQSYRDSFGPKSRDNAETSKLTEDREFLKKNHARAKLFLSSLRFRQQNILKIVLEILKHQQGFFERGAQAMRPLVLVDVANEIGLHTSTVSRLTTQKYLDTPHGVFELKYFFSNRVGSQPGREHSSVAIRSVVRRMIQDEDPGRPLSDQKIAHLLKDRDIDISRRTVTKYRESLSIPTSRERRRSA